MLALIGCGSRQVPTMVAPPAPPTVPTTVAVPAVAVPVCDAPPTSLPVVEGVLEGCPDASTLSVVLGWEGAAISQPDACPVPTLVQVIKIENDVESFFPGVASSDEGVRARRATDAELATLHLPESDDRPVWVYTPGNASPCQAVAGKVWVARKPSTGGSYVEISRALHGCVAPTVQRGEAPLLFAMASQQRPTQCEYRPIPTASTSGAASRQIVQRALPPRRCAAPGCEMGWSVASLESESFTVRDVQARYTTLQRGASNASPCTRPEAWVHRVMVEARGAAAPAEVPTEGPVAGVFVDGQGVRSLVTRESGNIDFFNVRGAAPTRVQHVVWYKIFEEEAGRWTIRTRCSDLARLRKSSSSIS
jgi:hypothetical protein